MLIHVIFQNQSHGYLEHSRFDELLAIFPIASFRRNDGWVRVGLDPMRSMATDSPPRTKNEERRKIVQGVKKTARSEHLKILNSSGNVSKQWR